MQYSLNQDLLIYMEPTKNISSMKGKGAVDCSNQMIPGIWLGLQESHWSGKLKTIDSQDMPQAIEVNPAFKEYQANFASQSSLVCHLHNLNKSSQIGPQATT